ncbi:MAG TPA: carboxylesterase/lipase family protein [Bryobacteraceae bacterium]|nr:carboxylesterase/lipase family protein [Bryobacteraceae bacterium]
MLLGRRSWIKSAGALALGESLSAAPPVTEGDSLIASGSVAVTETASGKVRGFVRRGIHTFRGIPYGAPTGGERRFMAPVRPAPWKRIRSSLTYGYVSPQESRTIWDKDEVAFVYQWDDGFQHEDCLRVNVWTQGLDNRKRPVMVWLHGGGFSTGSGHEMKAYDGENLARRGDVVVVSLNHRVGAVGFLNLASVGGEKYAASANVGLLDIIAALEWIRDNIRNFGGDPGNVTVFGQSGGGGKVTALMAMPRAAGLFHRAIVQSGSMLRMPGPELTAKLAAAVLKELGITKANLDQLHSLPVERIVAAGVTAAKAVFPAAGSPEPFDFERHAELVAWAPTVDGVILPESPFSNGAPALSAKVPLLVGSTRTEIGTGYDWPEFEYFPIRELTAFMTKAHGKEKAARVLEAFRRGHPGAKACDLFALWMSSGFRRATLRQASIKAAQGAAPAYVYLFAWNTPILDGRLRSSHCAELPFVFDNTDQCDTATGGGPLARALAANISEAWIRFAHTGDPNHQGLPKWPAFHPEKQATMVFDNTCAVTYDADREELNVLAAS